MKRTVPVAAFAVSVVANLLMVCLCYAFWRDPLLGCVTDDFLLKGAQHEATRQAMEDAQIVATRDLSLSDPRSLVAQMRFRGFPPDLVRAMNATYVNWRYEPQFNSGDLPKERLSKLIAERDALLAQLNGPIGNQ